MTRDRSPSVLAETPQGLSKRVEELEGRVVARASEKAVWPISRVTVQGTESQLNPPGWHSGVGLPRVMIVSTSGDEVPHIESLNSIDTADGRVLTIIYPDTGNPDQLPLSLGVPPGNEAVGGGFLSEATCPPGGSVTFLYDAPVGVWRIISSLPGWEVTDG